MKIVISALLALFLIGCSSDESKELQNTEPTQVVQESEEEVIVEDAEEAMIVEEADEEVIVEDQEDSIEAGIVEDVVVAEPSVEDGAAIYKLCSSCHGVNAEKAALGKSKIIQGWSVSQIAEALHGYKEGSYGGVMKGVMNAQVIKLSDEEIELVSEYISTL